jgi:hypothetical protein
VLLGLGREVKRMGINWRVKKERITPTLAIIVGFFLFEDVNVMFSTGETQCEMTETFWPRRTTGPYFSTLLRNPKIHFYPVWGILKELKSRRKEKSKSRDNYVVKVAQNL